MTYLLDTNVCIRYLNGRGVGVLEHMRRTATSEIAIAIANDLTLVTHNVAEFGRVPGLRFEDWEASASTPN